MTDNELSELVWKKLSDLGYVRLSLDCYVTTKCPNEIAACLDSSGGFIYDSVEIKRGCLLTLVELLGAELNEFSI